MAITVAQLHTHLEAARAALGSGDYAAAEVAALQAQAVLAGLPDSDKDGTRMEWRSTIKDLLAAIATGRASAVAVSAGGLQVAKITYTAPEE